MTDREKLVGLLDNFGVDDDWYTNTEIADYLLSNGVRLETKQVTSDENKRWHSVSDCLPKPKDVVLCRWTNGKCNYYGFATYQPHNVWYVHNEGMPRVTHWMPLPSTEGLK